MNQIPQWQQQRRQRRHSWPSRCCGILFIAVVCLVLYIILYSISYVICLAFSTFILYLSLVVGGGRWWWVVVGGGQIFVMYCLRGLFSDRAKIVLKLKRPFSQGGPKRGNPTMTTSTVTARSKGGPQHYVEGNKIRTTFVPQVSDFFWF